MSLTLYVLEMGAHKNATPETNVNIPILIKIDERSIYADYPEVIRNHTA